MVSGTHFYKKGETEIRKEEEVVFNGMEIEQVRENEMERQRCTTLENLLGMRLSSDQLGAENGKKQAC